MAAAMQREHTDARATARKRNGIGAAYDFGATTARQRDGVWQWRGKNGVATTAR